MLHLFYHLCGVFNSFLAFFGFFRFIGFAFSITALILGIVAINKKKQKGLGIAGLVISIIAILILCFMWFMRWVNDQNNKIDRFSNTSKTSNTVNTTIANTSTDDLKSISLNEEWLIDGEFNVKLKLISLEDINKAIDEKGNYDDFINITYSYKNIDYNGLTNNGILSIIFPTVTDEKGESALLYSGKGSSNLQTHKDGVSKGQEGIDTLSYLLKNKSNKIKIKFIGFDNNKNPIEKEFEVDISNLYSSNNDSLNNTISNTNTSATNTTNSSAIETSKKKNTITITNGVVGSYGKKESDGSIIYNIPAGKYKVKFDQTNSSAVVGTIFLQEDDSHYEDGELVHPIIETYRFNTNDGFTHEINIEESQNIYTTINSVFILEEM